MACPLEAGFETSKFDRLRVEEGKPAALHLLSPMYTFADHC